MSKKVGNKFYVEEEQDEECEYCGKIAELRPYGKNGARICFQCGMEDIGTTEKMFSKELEGVDTVVVNNKHLN